PKLRSRLGHGRDFALVGRQQAASFRAADKAGWETDEGTLVVNISPPALAAMRQTLRAVRGNYTWPELPGLTVEVRPSEITDSQGNVIEVIGWPNPTRLPKRALHQETHPPPGTAEPFRPPPQGGRRENPSRQLSNLPP